VKYALSTAGGWWVVDGGADVVVGGTEVRGRRVATASRAASAIQIHTTPFLTINNDAVLALRAVPAADTALAPVGRTAAFATFKARAARAAREAAGVA